jgi:hypothetical protein
MTDSSTGGFLGPLPAPAPVPIDGGALNDFIQTMLAALTGLDPALVRPAFQSEPPDVPDAGVAWMAFRTAQRPANDFPALVHHDGYDEFQRHEAIHTLCSFYDLGTSGLADYYAALLRDNLMLPQNAEYLTSQGFGMGFVQDKTAVPVIVKMRWQYRVDMPFVLRRAVVRWYSVLNVAAATGTVNAGSVSKNFTVSQ